MIGFAARVLTALACAAGLAVAAPATGHADPGACTATPGPGGPGTGQPATAGTATCPAGAGDFWFRVAVDCYDAYPSLHFVGVGYGPWVYAGGTSAATSSVPCHGYVPGSGLAWNGRVETR